MRSRPRFGEGITGWAVENRRPVWTNRAHLDPRAITVPGTPIEPEAMISIPLIARGALKGALNIYRIGEDAEFARARVPSRTVVRRRCGACARQRADPRAPRAPRADGLADVAVQPPLLPRATPCGADTRLALARHGRRADVRPRRLQARQRRVWPRRRRPNARSSVARVARETVRGSDVVCRIGGEEFGVIMPSCDAGDALGLASRMSRGATRASMSTRRAASPSRWASRRVPITR